jgi:basic membrane protein A
MAKKIIACLLIVLTVFSIGCKKNDPDVPAVTVTPINKLALVTADVELELDFDYAAIWEGILYCCQANNINYSFYMPVDMTEASLAEQFEFAVTDGASIILCMGDEFAPVIKTMQDKYPDVKFVGIDVSKDAIGELKPNTHIVMFRQEQGAYLAGYGAVKDGFLKLAYIGDHKSETYLSYANGFVQGINDAAKELNVQVEVNIAYISDFASREEAFNHVGRWYGENKTELVMFSADDHFIGSCAQHAVNNLGYMIGTDNDKAHLGANLDYNPFITSCIKGTREVVDTTLEIILLNGWNDQLGGRTLYYGLQNGAYIYLPEYEATWLFHGFTLEQYNVLKGAISSGTVLIDGANMPNVNTDLVTVNVYTPPVAAE